MPILPLLQYPLVNGHRYDYTSIEINLGGVLFSGIKSINYKHSLDPGLVRGTRAQVVGRTRGQYEAEGSIEFYKNEYDAFIAQLMLLNPNFGYLEQSFDADIHYSEPLQTVITDRCVGCRLKNADHSPAEGNDPITVSCDLSILYIIENGKTPINPKQFLK